MAWRLRLDVADDGNSSKRKRSRDAWRVRLAIVFVVVVLTIWVALVAALADWLAART